MPCAVTTNSNSPPESPTYCQEGDRRTLTEGLTDAELDQAIADAERAIARAQGKESMEGAQ